MVAGGSALVNCSVTVSVQASQQQSALHLGTCNGKIVHCALELGTRDFKRSTAICGLDRAVHFSQGIDDSRHRTAKKLAISSEDAWK